MQNLEKQKKTHKKVSFFYFLLSLVILGLGVDGLITGNFLNPSRRSRNDWIYLEGMSAWIMFFGFISCAISVWLIALYLFNDKPRTAKYNRSVQISFAIGFVFFISTYLIEIIKLTNPQI